jgi:hypothetical protein
MIPKVLTYVVSRGSPRSVVDEHSVQVVDQFFFDGTIPIPIGSRSVNLFIQIRTHVQYFWEWNDLIHFLPVQRRPEENEFKIRDKSTDMLKIFTENQQNIYFF